MLGVDIGFTIRNQTHLNLDRDEIKIIPLLSSQAWSEQTHVCELCKERRDIFIAIYNDFDAR